MSKSNSPKRKSSKIILTIFGMVILLGIIFVIALPTILSTRWGNEKIGSIVNAKISGKITFEKLNISWLGEQAVEDVKLYNSEGREIASLELGLAKTTLWNLLFSHRKQGIYEFKGLNAHIVQRRDGKTNIEQALSRKGSGEEIGGQQGLLTIALQNVNVMADLKDEKNNRIQMTGKTLLDGKEGAFDVNLAINNLFKSKVFSKTHFLNIEELGKIQAHANIQNFPVSLLDEALALSNPERKGLLLRIFGEQLNVNMQESKGKEGIDLNLKINSPLVQAVVDGILREEQQIQLKAKVLSSPNNSILYPLFGSEIDFEGQTRLGFDHFKGELEVEKGDFISFISAPLKVNFDAQMTSFEKLRGSIQIAIKSKNLEGQGFFQVEDDLLINKPGVPANLKLLLAPEQFQNFKRRFNRQTNIVLTSPVEVALNIDSFTLPLQDHLSPNWFQGSITSNVAIRSLGLKDIGSGQQVLLENIVGKLESPEFSKNVAFLLDGQNYDKEGKAYSFSVKGTADDTFKNTGEINIDHLALKLDAQFQKFPVILLGQFFGVDQVIAKKISVLLGDLINVELSTELKHLQGPVNANLSGPNGQISLNANVNQGILTLNKNFYSQFIPTQEFGKVILVDIFPLGEGLIGADNPFTVDIDATGFVLPIKNFDISAVKVGAAKLEFGKVRFRSDGQFGSVLSLLNNFRRDEIPVWFTPMYASMKNGVITFQRMDMLIMNTYPIATWGTVNLAAEKVNMIIGLTGKALMKGMGLQNVDKDYILQIPFKGTMENADIDKKKATAKIAALVAANHGTEGMILGTALNIAAGGLTEEKAPAPTTQPLPWSLEVEASSSEVPEAEKPKEDKNPLKHVEKKASSLLRNLLPIK